MNLLPWNLLPFTPPSQALNRKAALLDLQRGESFLIRIKAALGTLWSTYLLFSAYQKNISGDLPSLCKILLYRHLFLREGVQAFSHFCALSSPRVGFSGTFSSLLEDSQASQASLWPQAYDSTLPERRALRII